MKQKDEETRQVLQSSTQTTPHATRNKQLKSYINSHNTFLLLFCNGPKVNYFSMLLTTIDVKDN